MVFYFNILPVDHGGQIMEYDWITNVLLGKINRPIKIILPEEFSKEPQNDTLHVFLFNPKNNLFKELKTRGFVNQGAFHMGDEKFECDIGFYSTVDYVFRNYYNRDILKKYPNVHFAPLGYKSGFGEISTSTLLPASERRKYVVNFIGSIRNNRKYVIDKIVERNITGNSITNYYRYPKFKK